MNENEYKILLVDDEPDIIEFIGYNLKRQGYKVFSASNGTEAISVARSVMPHLVLLDVMMPRMDGLETCREMRKISSLSDTLIVFLTARGGDYAQIAGFDSGGDDYITKPIKPGLLISRVKALLRRYSGQVSQGKVLHLGNITIDRERYIILKEDKEIVLPKKEFEIISYLASKPNKVFTREEIFANVWGSEVIVGDRTIDVHVRKLREKIGIENIKTVKGVGYKFEI